MTDSNKERAQAPYMPTFARLGRSVWFALESSQRSDPARAAGLEERLDAVGVQVQQVAAMGMSRMPVGEWSSRRLWGDEEWAAFLRTWQPHAAKKQLVTTFSVYWAYYANLPDRPDNAPENQTIEMAGRRVDELLDAFQNRLGDPLKMCHACGKCAVGRRLLRCGRCKRVCYCSQDCQKVDWTRGGHKRTCVPISKNPRELDKLVRCRYSELRREGKDTKVAMDTARKEYGVDKQDAKDVGSQVAAMFGLGL